MKSEYTNNFVKKSLTYFPGYKAMINLNSISRHFCYKITFLVIGLVFLLNGCTKWLDVKPESEIILEDYWQTGDDATAVVGACYKALTEDGCMSRMILWGEGRSDNVMSVSALDYDIYKLTSFDFSPSNQFCSWGPFYTVINYCNTFLHFAPGILKKDKNFTEAELESLTAEVKTIRALAYFYLIRAYKNVPWIEEPSINDVQDYQVTQSTESEIIPKLIDDLNAALQSAPTEYGSLEQNKGRITKNAVRALLADIYLWDNQYENCIQQCNEIMADKQLSFVDLKQFSSTYISLFGKGNSSESIFELQFGDKDGKQPNYMVKWLYGGYGYIGIGRLTYSPFLAPKAEKSPFYRKVGNATESEEDIRYKDFIVDRSTSYGDYTIFKYAGYQRIENADGKSSNYYYVSNSSNWIIYRLCDIILMKAEALVQLNRGEDDMREAMLMVNTTYMRSNTKLQGDSLRRENYQTQEDMAQLVMRERQRELLFEGKRWFDLVRLARRNKSLSGLVAYISPKFTENGSQVSSKASLDALYLPVFKDDLKNNPKLVQNPFYKTASSE